MSQDTNTKSPPPFFRLKGGEPRVESLADFAGIVRMKERISIVWGILGLIVAAAAALVYFILTHYRNVVDPFLPSGLSLRSGVAIVFGVIGGVGYFLFQGTELHKRNMAVFRVYRSIKRFEDCVETMETAIRFGDRPTVADCVEGLEALAPHLGECSDYKKVLSRGRTWLCTALLTDKDSLRR